MLPILSFNKKETKMKKELEGVTIEKKQSAGDRGGLSSLIENNKGVVKALGIASFVALAGYSTAQLLKDKKLMKKIKDGLKTQKAIKYIENILSLDALKNLLPAKGAKEMIQAEAKKNVKTTNRKADSKIETATASAAPPVVVAPIKQSPFSTPKAKKKEKKKEAKEQPKAKVEAPKEKSKGKTQEKSKAKTSKKK